MLSGPDWCNQFPTSKSLDDLIDPFKTNCKNFIEALTKAGATVVIAATYRPVERAFLMHFSALLSEGKIKASDIPKFPGIDIQWNQGNEIASIGAAKQMAKKYGILYPPALASRHTERLAIDMDIHYPASITLSDGTKITTHEDLVVAGANFGVIKFKYGIDPPHWSSDGH